jgi:hypothetical protein
MNSQAVRLLAGWALLVSAGLCVWAQENASKPEALPVAPKPAVTLPELPLPKDQIVVVVEDLKQALERSPVRWVLLSPEAYQKLLQQMQAGRATTEPSVMLAECHYRGQVVQPEGSVGRAVLLLQMRLVFATTRSEQQVMVGLKGARLTRAELDGAAVRWVASDGRLAALVPSAGRHELLLETALPVSYDAGQRQYTAVLDDTPAAVVTTLDVIIPGKVETAAVKNGGGLRLEFGDWPALNHRETAVGKITGTRLRSDALGPISRLELGWRVSEGQPSGPAGTLTGSLQVTLRGGVVETEARMTMTVRQGQVNQIRLRLPPRSTQVSWTEESGNLWNPLEPDSQAIVTIRFPTALNPANPSRSWLLRWQQQVPEKGPMRIPIGRLELVDPAGYEQTGTIEVSNPENRPLSVIGQLQAIEANRFRYLAQPAQLELRLDESSALPPLVEVQAQYRVSVTPKVIHVRSDWQITRVVRLTLRQLEIDWPEGFELDRRGLPASWIIEQPQPQKVHIRFTNDQALPNHVSLEGWYPLENADAVPGSNRRGQTDIASHLPSGNGLPLVVRKPFALPWLARAHGEQYGRTVQTQVQLLEAKVRFPEPEGPHRLVPYQLALGPETRGLLAGSGRRFYTQLPVDLPAELQWDRHNQEERIVLDLVWRRQLPIVQWEGKLCITRQSWHLEQVLRWQGKNIPTTLNLQVPPELRALKQVRVRVAVTDGKTTRWQEEKLRLEEVSNQSEEEAALRRVVLPQSLVAGDDKSGWRGLSACEISVSHTATLALGEDAGSTLSVPMVLPVPTEAELQRLRLRCWHTTDLSVAPLPGSLWQPDVSPRQVSELPPNLSVTTTSTDAPLVLRLNPVQARPFLADRMLVLLRPVHDRTGQLDVQVKYWLSQLGSGNLTLQLPPDAALTKVLCNGKQLSASLESVDAGTSRLRLELEPQFLSRPVLLELDYRLNPSRAQGWSWLSGLIRWPTRCRMPVSEPPIEPGLVRWGLAAEPSLRPAFIATSAWPEENWRWRFDTWAIWNWLQFPASTQTLQNLDQWLTSGQDAAQDAGTPVYLWRQYGAADEMQVWLVSSHAWTLGCSVLVVILSAIWLYGPGWLRLPMLTVSLLALLILAWHSTWSLLAVLAGALPGILVATVLIAGIELQRWWWEKRLEWQAGFAPAPFGSTIQPIPIGSKSPPPAQPRSTVEAPAGQLPQPLPTSTGQTGSKQSPAPAS